LYKFDGALIRSAIAKFLSYLIKPLIKIGIRISAAVATVFASYLLAAISLSPGIMVVKLLEKTIFKGKSRNLKFGKGWFTWHWDCFVF